MRDFLVALGLVLVLEGLLFAAGGFVVAAVGWEFALTLLHRGGGGPLSDGVNGIDHFSA